MGEAKRRGTFEERLAKAIGRNQALEGAISKSSNLVKFKQRYGTQRLATRLVMSGMLVATKP